MTECDQEHQRMTTLIPFRDIVTKMKVTDAHISAHNEPYPLTSHPMLDYTRQFHHLTLQLMLYLRQPTLASIVQDTTPSYCP